MKLWWNLCFPLFFCLLSSFFLPTNKSPLLPHKGKDGKEAHTVYSSFPQIFSIIHIFCAWHTKKKYKYFNIKHRKVLATTLQRRKPLLVYRKGVGFHEIGKLAQGHTVRKRAKWLQSSRYVNQWFGSAHLLTGYSNLKLNVCIPEPAPISVTDNSRQHMLACEVWGVRSTCNQSGATAMCLHTSLLASLTAPSGGGKLPEGCSMKALSTQLLLILFSQPLTHSTASGVATSALWETWQLPRSHPKVLLQPPQGTSYPEPALQDSKTITGVYKKPGTLSVKGQDSEKWYKG